MGMNVEGRLFYGYVWPEQDWRLDDPPPSRPFDESIDTYSLGDEFVEVGYHGSDGYSYPDVFVKSTEIEVDWEEAKEFFPLVMNGAIDSYNSQLAAWIAKTGANIEGANGPGWFLTAYYG